jgi:adenylate kinase
MMADTALSSTPTQTTPLLAGVGFIPFISKPNSGKGTQTDLLNQRLGLPRIDMGAMLREVAKDDTELGCMVADTLAQGQLVTLDVVIDVLKAGLAKRLATLETTAQRLFVLDGFPRSDEQAKALDEMCQSQGASIIKAIYLTLPDEVVIERAAARLICGDCGAIYNTQSKPPQQEGVCDVCGGTHLARRIDDEPERVAKRLVSFENDTQPLVAYYQAQGLLVNVDGHRSVETVYATLLAELQAAVPTLTAQAS